MKNKNKQKKAICNYILKHKKKLEKHRLIQTLQALDLADVIIKTYNKRQIYSISTMFEKKIIKRYSIDLTFYNKVFNKGKLKTCTVHNVSIKLFTNYISGGHVAQVSVILNSLKKMSHVYLIFNVYF